MATRPRLLHIVGGSAFGGGGVLIVEMARTARQNGIDAAVLTTDPIFQGKLSEAGVPFVDADVIRRPIRPLWDLRGLMRLRALLRDGRYDIVQTHTSKGGFIGRLAARLARVPAIIHTVHGFSFHEYSTAAARWAYASLERIAAGWCDRIVTVSEYHRRVALEMGIGSPEQVMAIPNGLDADRCRATLDRETARAGLDLHADDFGLLALGRLAPQKGFTYLLRALAIDRDPTMKLLVVGVGPLEADLKREAALLGLDAQVTFLGFRNDIGDLFQACDLVTLPSLYEGLSIALLEAMAAGRPIVTTTIPSNVEVTRGGEGAVLVPPMDPQALRDALRSLRSDPGRRQELAKKALARFDESYTQERMLESYLALYRSLLSEESPAG